MWRERKLLWTAAREETHDPAAMSSPLYLIHTEREKERNGGVERALIRVRRGGSLQHQTYLPLMNSTCVVVGVKLGRKSTAEGSKEKECFFIHSALYGSLS